VHGNHMVSRVLRPDRHAAPARHPRRPRRATRAPRPGL